jgi:O-antigen ligase
MAVVEGRFAGGAGRGRAVFLGCVILGGLIAGIVSIPALAMADLPVVLSILAPIAVVAGLVFLWDTDYGLYFVAFALGPLGIVRHEFVSVTVNLPEVLILLLAAKEAIRFIVRGERFVPFLPAWTLLLYLIAAGIGLITGFVRGNYPTLVLQDCRQYIEYVVLYLVVLHRVSTRRQIWVILVCFLAGMTLLGMHGIIQRLTGWGIPASQAISDAIYHKGIRSGSFYGATPLGGLMVFALGTAAGLGFGSRSRIWQAMIAGCACICMMAAVLTNTRASWIAIAFLMLFLFFSIRKTKLMIVGSVIAVTVFSVFFGPQVVQRMKKIEISKKEQSGLQRVRYYTAAWHIFVAQPVLGLGWGCDFSVRDINLNDHYVPPPPRARILKKPIWVESTVHSAYLQVLVRTGLVGLVTLLAFLAQWFMNVVRERFVTPRNEIDHNLFIGASGGVLGYLLHSGIENFFQWPIMAQSFWLLLGLTTVMAFQLTRKGALDTGGNQGPAPPPVAAEA